MVASVADRGEYKAALRPPGSDVGSTNLKARRALMPRIAPSGASNLAAKR
jgi:hypothetical protein